MLGRLVFCSAETARGDSAVLVRTIATIADIDTPAMVCGLMVSSLLAVRIETMANDLFGNATERTLNGTWYLGNRFNLGGGLNININLEFWNTDYLTLENGDAMRFKTVLIQRF